MEPGEAEGLRCLEVLESGDPLCVVDADYRVTHVNAAQERVSGIPRTRSVGRTLWEIWPEIDTPSSVFGQNYRRCMTERVECRFEAWFEPLQRWFELRTVPLAQGGFVLWFRDITSEKAFERDLLVSKERLRLFVEHAPAAIALFDRELRYLAHSRRYVADYGLPPQSLVGRSHYEVFPTIPERWKALHQRALAGEQLRAEEDRFELADGKVEWVKWEIVPWREPDGAIGGIVLFTESVTRFKKAEEALATQLDLTHRAEEQLRHAQKMEAVGRLAGGVAHDFNNMLTVILASADFIAGSLPEEHELREEATEITRAAERAANLTRQLLAFSRKQPSAPRAVNVDELLSRLEPLLRRLLGDEVSLVIETTPGGPSCKADPAQLEQVVLNLVINARDAMPKGGSIRIATGELEVDPEILARHPEVCPGQHVTLTIADTGTGMTPEVQRHLFEPFFTTKPQGKGTGLGLATAYGIVQQHGGTITVNSTPGRGSTFRVSLPVTGEGAEATRDVTSVGPWGARGRGTVLLAEDEPRVRAVISSMLQRAGFEVLEASDGREAVALLGKNTPVSLVITDVKMPEMDGPALAARLEQERPGTPVLFLSGYAGDEAGALGMLPPGAVLLGKPFTRDDLLGRVRALLEAPV